MPIRMRRNSREHVNKVKEEMKKVEDTPSVVKKERHGRNVQLFQHGICVSGNNLINRILDQVYAKRNESRSHV